MIEDANGTRDFFISFNQADRVWATWIAWTLEEAGYSVFFQDWDFTGNFILEMDRAHTHSRRTIAVVSPDFLASRFAAPEWAARFAEDAASDHDLLIPVQPAMRARRPAGTVGLYRPARLRQVRGARAATQPCRRYPPQAGRAATVPRGLGPSRSARTADLPRGGGANTKAAADEVDVPLVAPPATADAGFDHRGHPDVLCNRRHLSQGESRRCAWLLPDPEPLAGCPVDTNRTGRIR